MHYWQTYYKTRNSYGLHEGLYTQKNPYYVVHLFYCGSIHFRSTAGNVNVKYCACASTSSHHMLTSHAHSSCKSRSSCQIRSGRCVYVSMSYCVSSFFFLQDYLLPERISMGDIKDKMMKYATEHPLKFVALATFTTLGGVPVITFLAYSVATIIASLIGAVILELFLLVVGITALAFVLVFVSCATVCVTSLAMAFYYVLAAANCSWKLRKSRHSWSSSSPTYRHPPPPDPSRLSEHNDDDEPFDKSK